MAHEPTPQLLDRLDHVQAKLYRLAGNGDIMEVREILQLLKDEVSEIRGSAREHH